MYEICDHEFPGDYITKFLLEYTSEVANKGFFTSIHMNTRDESSTWQWQWNRQKHAMQY